LTKSIFQIRDVSIKRFFLLNVGDREYFWETLIRVVPDRSRSGGFRAIPDRSDFNFHFKILFKHKGHETTFSIGLPV